MKAADVGDDVFGGYSRLRSREWGGGGKKHDQFQVGVQKGTKSRQHKVWELEKYTNFKNKAIDRSFNMSSEIYFF